MKKILLSLITFLSVAMCSIVAFIGLSSTPKTAIGWGDYKNIGEEVIIDNSTPKPIEKPSTITYAPNTISVQKGGDSINYSYTPSVNAQDETTPTHTVAYEYCFGNPMDRKTAVNLKSIDTTGVNVSYYYSTSKIDTTETLIGETDYTLQELEINGTTGDEVYIYVLVSPTNENIPTTFTQRIVWYYGIPQQISIIDNVTNTVIDTQTIVSGQAIDDETLTKPASFTRTEEDYWGGNIETTYYFDAWFYDRDFTQLVDGVNSAGRKIYARFHNVPINTTDYLQYVNGEYILSSDEHWQSTEETNGYGQGSGQALTYAIGEIDIIIPVIYDDGVNGPARVTGIGYYAFNDDELSDGSYAKSVTLPCTITSIADGAFSGLSAIVDFDACINLQTIGSYAFDGVTLQSIKLPKTVISIGSCAFRAGENFEVTSIVVEDGNSIYDSRNNCNAIIETATNMLILGCKNTIIPNDIEVIGSSAFYSCRSLTSIDLSKCTSLTSIGSSAFIYCRSLTSITIPSSVTSIDSKAFFDCYNLYEVYNLSSLSISKGSSNGYVGYYAKAIHTSLTEASVLTTIGGVVYYMESASSYIALSETGEISDITLDSRTTAINQFAFYYCDSLTSITIPASVTKIGYFAFGGCSNLTSITFEDTSTWYKTSSSSYTGGSVVDVTNPTQNATWLMDKYNYYNYYWYKV